MIYVTNTSHRSHKPGEIRCLFTCWQAPAEEFVAEHVRKIFYSAGNWPVVLTIVDSCFCPDLVVRYFSINFRVQSQADKYIFRMNSNLHSEIDSRFYFLTSDFGQERTNYESKYYLKADTHERLHNQQKGDRPAFRPSVIFVVVIVSIILLQNG